MVTIHHKMIKIQQSKICITILDLEQIYIWELLLIQIMMITYQIIKGMYQHLKKQKKIMS